MAGRYRFPAFFDADSAGQPAAWWEVWWDREDATFRGILWVREHEDADQDLPEEDVVVGVAGSWPAECLEVRTLVDHMDQLELGVELPEGLAEQLLADRIDHLGVLTEAERAELAERVEAKRQEMAPAS